jgi:hypothetical protein
LTQQAAVRARAREVAEERLLRARSLLHAVTPDERAAIEEAAYTIASEVAECLLEEAARCPIVAAALTVEVPLSEGDRRRLCSPDSAAGSGSRRLTLETLTLREVSEPPSGTSAEKRRRLL